MAKKKLSLIVWILPLLLAACTNKEVLTGKETSLVKETVTAGNQDIIFPDASPSVPDGEVTWQKLNCAACHGVDGKGASGKSTVNLTDKNYMNKQKPVDQYRFLAFGKPDSSHPAVNKLVSRRDAWNLVFYVRSLARYPMAPMPSPQFMAIDPVFGSNCAVCHGKKGYGDGPLSHNLEPSPANFQDFKRFYDRSDAVLWDHIANGIKWEGMPNFLGKEDKAKNVKFDDAYIWKLVDYVRQFQETTIKTSPGDAKTVKGKNLST